MGTDGVMVEGQAVMMAGTDAAYGAQMPMK